MRAHILASLTLITATALAQNAGEPVTSQNNERLRKGLEQYPQADTNKDGVLTLEEGRAFLATMTKGGDKPATAKVAAKGIAPTHADIAYGPHERNKLDFWQAKSDKPTPIVVFIHGGGFTSGDKSRWATSNDVKQLLDKGVSCAAINYRYILHAPLPDVLRDCARAVQFIRSRSAEWNIDKTRVAAQGGSAGAGTSLWLATRDDLADASASDPVLRESTRVCAAVCSATQATYDVTRWESYLGKADPSWERPEQGSLFYGVKSNDDLKTEAGKKILADCDMLAWISKDDAPIMCVCNQPDGPIKDRGHWLHHPKHALEVKKHCDEHGIPCTVFHPDGKDKGAANPTLTFLLAQLKVAQ